MASGFCLTIAVVGAFCFRERAENKGTWPINPLPETPYASGFPVKPIILGKIIGFGGERPPFLPTRGVLYRTDTAYGPALPLRGRELLGTTKSSGVVSNGRIEVVAIERKQVTVGKVMSTPAKRPPPRCVGGIFRVRVGRG